MNRPAKLESPEIKEDGVTYVLGCQTPLKHGGAYYEYLWSSLDGGDRISGRIPERDVTKHRGVP